MKHNERNDYNLFRKHIALPGDRIDRIENIVVPGMPDTNICLNGIECWIEYKSPKEPVRARTPLFGSNHKVSQNQKNWFLRQRQAGGRGYFLIATNIRWMLINGTNADSMNELTVKKLQEISLWWALKPVLAIQWDDLRKTLIETR